VQEVLVKSPRAGIHYYLENDKVVFTEKFHIERGFCCGKSCRHCPFDPKYKKGNKKIDKDQKP